MKKKEAFVNVFHPGTKQKGGFGGFLRFWDSIQEGTLEVRREKERLSQNTSAFDLLGAEAGTRNCYGEKKLPQLILQP